MRPFREAYEETLSLEMSVDEVVDNVFSDGLLPLDS